MGRFGKVDDADLVKLLKVADRDEANEILAEIGRRHGGLVFHLTLRLFPVLKPEDLDEIANDALFAAHRDIRRYDPKRGKLSTWLGRIAYNRARTRMKSIHSGKSGAVGYTGDAEFLENCGEARDDSADLLWEKEIHEVINREMSKMSPLQRAIVQMEMTPGIGMIPDQKLASRYHTTVGNVQVQRCKAHERLRQALLQAGFGSRRGQERCDERE